MKILIADDDPICLRRLEYFFHESPQQILRATNGLEAWEIIENESIQLAILDWEMPGLSGVEICRNFREKNSSEFLYLMLLTSRNSRQDIDQGIEWGADDFLTKPLDSQELKVRLRAATRIIEFQKLIARTALTDSLTGIWNRRAIFNCLQKEHERSIRSGHDYSVILCDLDHFKGINDQYGHIAGDIVLKHIAQLISTVIRTSDSVGRYGGEEFFIVLPETDQSKAKCLAERLRLSIENSKIHIGEGEISVSMSLGLSVNPRAINSVDSMLRQADLALYASKNAGRNRWTAFSHELTQNQSTFSK